MKEANLALTFLIAWFTYMLSFNNLYMSKLSPFPHQHSSLSRLKKIKNSHVLSVVFYFLMPIEALNNCVFQNVLFVYSRHLFPFFLINFGIILCQILKYFLWSAVSYKI